MTRIPLLYFPLFVPPKKAETDPSTYYSDLGSTALVAPEPGGSLVITFTNPQAAYPTDEVDQPMPLAALFAPTRGFLTFYPAAAALPTPDLQPLTLPANVQAQDVGTLVLRVWAADHRRLGSTIPPGAIRPTHILIGGVRDSEAEAALAPVVAKLPERVLLKAWQDAGGSGTIPDRPGLEDAYLQRVMSNSAEIFVSAGTHIGTTTTAYDAASASTLGWVLLRTFGPDQQKVLTDTEAMALLDDVFAATGSGAPDSIYEDHPLILATSAEQTVHFQCQMMIWDNALTPTKNYMPFKNGQVTLLRNGQLEGPAIPTDANGNVAFTADLSPRDQIAFEYSTINRYVGTRTFTTNLQTEPQRLGVVLGAAATVVKPFRAKYDIFTDYYAFWLTLRQDEAIEKYGADRGNSQAGLKSFKNQEEWLFNVIKESERNYRTGAASPSHFNILYEGDSWLFYPRSKDIYQWLRDMISTKIKSPFEYRGFPLQHFGDRTDQMFAASAPVIEGPAIISAVRQWSFTQEYLTEFPIDLIVMSAGGNDIAEPGISVSDKNFFGGLFDGDLFDATKAQSWLAPDKLVIAKNLMHRSFSIMLKNHPWNIAARSSPATQKKAWDIDEEAAILFGKIGKNYAGSDGPRAAIVKAVIEDFPDDLQFPYEISNNYELLLDIIYDRARLAERLELIRTNLAIMIQEAVVLGIPVVMHSCSYPFFNEQPTTVGPFYGSGPWFVQRFVEANIRDLRLKLIALKGLVDSYTNHVINWLQDLYPDTLYCADIRKEVIDEKYWNDEMHLTSEGFERVSKKIFYEVVKACPDPF